jgi:serine/threonine-protein kinase RsbW
MEFLSYRTENSTEHDGGNAMMAAVEYWNDGVVFNDRRNRVAAMRSFGEEGVPE